MIGLKAQPLLLPPGTHPLGRKNMPEQHMLSNTMGPTPGERTNDVPDVA